MTTPPQPRGYYPMNPMYHVGKNLMGGLIGSSSHLASPWLDSRAPIPLHFIATLDIPSLYKLKNYPINHNLHWPPIPYKIPTDIPKFEGKQGDDSAMHVTTYNLWCVSNSMVDDNIRLILFPNTLTGNYYKWYIQIPPTLVKTFSAVTMELLKHFQLLIC